MSAPVPPAGDTPYPPPEDPYGTYDGGVAYPASTSGAYAFDSGAYPAPAGLPAAYPAPPAPAVPPSGAHPAVPPAHSGAYPTHGYGYGSGAYPGPAYGSGVYPVPSPSGAYPVPYPSGAYPAPYPSGAYPVPAGAAPLMGGAQAEAGIRMVLERTYRAILPAVARNDNAPLMNPVHGSTLRRVPVARLMGYSDVMTVISAARRGALLGVIERAWLSFGFVVEEVNGDFAMPSMDVRTPDGFTAQVQVGAPGNVYFTVSSPLIERPGDPFAYSGPLEPTLLPDVDDPFWSH